MGDRVRDVRGATVNEAMPDKASLEAHLSSLLGRPVTVSKRVRNPYTSTFPTEVVTYADPDGVQADLFMKYTYPEPSRQVPDHYEAMVYEDILEQLPVTLPRYYGAIRHVEGRGTWLVLEHVTPSHWLEAAPDACRDVELAAGWLAAFHRQCSASPQLLKHRLLVSVDGGHLQGCLDRMRQTVHGCEGDHPWLPGFAQRAWPYLSQLFEQRQTVVHREFYPRNILIRDRQVYPVDWETAATGPATLDLATLTEGWAPEIRQRGIEAYAEELGADVAEVESLLRLASLYNHIRWLAHPEWRGTRGVARQLRRLHTAAQEVGIA